MSEIKEKEFRVLTSVTVRFAGDSGDGMQLTGTQFSDTTAFIGNDLNTLPDYPAEIRAPAGTLYGVSGFQLHFGSEDVNTPGDIPDVLVAMNPAALKKNLKELTRGGVLIINSDSFDQKNLNLAHYESNPLQDDTLSGYELHQVPITSLTANALEGLPLSPKEVSRCKNFFALGLMYWLYDRPLKNTEDWIKEKFSKNPEYIEANTKALQAGYNFGEMTEVFTTRYKVEPAKLPKGTYRNISGNEATALGFLTASVKSGLPLFLGSYPITPASEILQYLSTYKSFGVKTVQAEDEIAGITAAIGASFVGHLAITTTSGPGLALKTEAIGLAVMTELPLVVIDVQRGGPSTGLPTKTEQADLLQAIYGRNGEAPVCVLAARTPRDCFYMAIEASRIALKYMTPVILLTDGYLANGSEPWRVPHQPSPLPARQLQEVPIVMVAVPHKDVTDATLYSLRQAVARALGTRPGARLACVTVITQQPDQHHGRGQQRDQCAPPLPDHAAPVGPAAGPPGPPDLLPRARDRGDVAQALLDYARGNNVSVIVMGAATHGLKTQRFVATVPIKVAMDAPCTIILVKQSPAV